MLHRAVGAAPTAPFIAVNLAAIPRELVESTLFGHEKGVVHRRDAAAHRQVRAGQRRHAVPRRDRRSQVSTCRPSCCARSRRARSSGSAAASRSNVQFRLIAATNVDLERAVKEGHVPRRPVLPHQRDSRAHCRRCASASRICRSWCDFFLQRYNARFRKNVQGIADVHAADAAELLVAGQHPRAREPGRAPGRDLRPRLDHRRATCRSSSRSPSSIATQVGRQPARPRARRPSSATSSSARSSAAAGTSRRRRATWACRSAR